MSRESVGLKLHDEEEMSKLREQDVIRNDHFTYNRLHRGNDNLQYSRENGEEGDGSSSSEMSGRLMMDMKPLSLNDYYSRKQAQLSQQQLNSRDSTVNTSTYHRDNASLQTAESAKQSAAWTQLSAKQKQRKWQMDAQAVPITYNSSMNTSNNSTIEQLKTLSSKFDHNSHSKEEVNRLIFHEENMDIMKPILDNSSIMEQKLVSKVGAQAFSSVAKHDRGVKRLEEIHDVNRTLHRIQNRTNQTKELRTTTPTTDERRSNSRGGVHSRASMNSSRNQQLTTDNRENNITHNSKSTTNNIFSHSSHPMHSHSSSVKGQWIDKIKNQARINLNELEQKKRIEEIVISAQIKQENTASMYKHTIDHLNDEKKMMEVNNKALKTNITLLEEEITSLKHTISLLRQKLSKLSSREVESQQKLKLFSDYQPLFEDLQKNFNFDSPMQVINRMELLEKQCADYMQQLLNAEHERNEMQRELEKTKQDVETENRERILGLTKNLERSERQAKELQKTVDVLQKAVEKANTYSKKYFDLNNAVIDIWDTWLNDINKIGYRDSMEAVAEELDRTDSNQLLSALKNLLIVFTPTKAGRNYTDMAILANRYWKRYFSMNIDLKSQPYTIFDSLGKYIDSKENEIGFLKKQLQMKCHEIKGLQESLAKTNREKKVAEHNLSTHKLFNAHHQRNISEEERFDGDDSIDNGKWKPWSSSSVYQTQRNMMLRRKSSTPLRSSNIHSARPNSAPARRGTRVQQTVTGDRAGLLSEKASGSSTNKAPMSARSSTQSGRMESRMDRNQTLSRIRQELNLPTGGTPDSKESSSESSVFITQGASLVT